MRRKKEELTSDLRGSTVMPTFTVVFSLLLLSLIFYRERIHLYRLHEKKGENEDTKVIDWA